MERNILQSKRVGSDYLRNTIFYGVVGILFTAFGVSQLNWLGLQAVVYVMIGLALLCETVANYLESRKYKSLSKNKLVNSDLVEWCSSIRETICMDVN